MLSASKVETTTIELCKPEYIRLKAVREYCVFLKEGPYVG